MDDLKQKWQQEISSRLTAVKIILILFIVGIFCRLIYIQFFDENIGKISHQVHKKLISSEVLYAVRGQILARNGEPHAASILRQSIFIDFASHGFDNDKRFASNADSLSKLLSSYFGDHTAKWYYNRMDSVHSKAMQRVQTGQLIKEKRQSPIKKLFRGKQYDTIPTYEIKRRHTHTRLFRDVDMNEWEQISQIGRASCRERV